MSRCIVGITLLPSKSNRSYTHKAHFTSSKKHISVVQLVAVPPSHSSDVQSAVETFNMVIHEKHGELISGSSLPTSLSLISAFPGTAGAF